MRTKRKIRLLIWGTCLLVFAGASVSAQTKAVKIRDDIQIMETILAKLLQSSRAFDFGGQNFKGIYFDDYGLLFTINLNNQFRVMNVERYLAVSERAREAQKKTEELAEKAKQLAEQQEEMAEKAKDKSKTVVIPSYAYTYTTGSENSKEEFDQWLAKLDQKIQTFLGSYVDINDQLQPNERISIVLFLGNGGENPLRARIYQTEKKDIIDYRKERITKPAFLTKISQQSVTDNDHAEEIDILSSILETAFAGKKGRGLIWGNPVNGIYLHDLGVMFSFNYDLVDERLTRGVNLEIIPNPVENFDDAKAHEVVVKMQQQRATEKKEYRAKLTKLEDDIVRIIGDYGTTLRFIPDAQSVFVLLGSDDRLNDEDATNIMIRLGKTDINAYSRSQIDLAKLRSRAQIIEY